MLFPPPAGRLPGDSESDVLPVRGEMLISGYAAFAMRGGVLLEVGEEVMPKDSSKESLKLK